MNLLEKNKPSSIMLSKPSNHNKNLKIVKAKSEPNLKKPVNILA